MECLFSVLDHATLRCKGMVRPSKVALIRKVQLAFLFDSVQELQASIHY